MNRILFCGFGRAGLEILNILLFRYPRSKIFVFTNIDPRNQALLDFVKAKQLDFSVKKINLELALIQKFKPNCLLSIYYPYIIKKQVIKMVKGRAMNLHPALLPKYRGCFSAPWVILNGEKQTGISFHYLVKETDQGKIILQKKIAIDSSDTAFSL